MPTAFALKKQLLGSTCSTSLIKAAPIWQHNNKWFEMIHACLACICQAMDNGYMRELHIWGLAGAAAWFSPLFWIACSVWALALPSAGRPSPADAVCGSLACAASYLLFWLVQLGLLLAHHAVLSPQEAPPVQVRAASLRRWPDHCRHVLCGLSGDNTHRCTRTHSRANSHMHTHSNTHSMYATHLRLYKHV